MGRPLGLWNFVRFVNDAVGSARKYEIIEAHWIYPAGVAAMIASWITKVPYRVYCHGTDVMMAERSRWWRYWAYRVVSNAQDVCSVSRFLAAKISKTLFSYSRVDPMEVDKSIFYDRGLSRNWVRFIIKKNLGKYLQVNKAVCGEGEAIFAEAQYSQKDLADIFNRCKVVVLASENEGYGLMLAEAAECGCKIIGVNEGGIPEVVSKYGGLLFDGTAEDLREKINIALTRETVTV